MSTKLNHDKDSSHSRFITAEPYQFHYDIEKTALIMIDMQKDFLEPKGFGEMLGNNVSLLREIIRPCKQLLDVARQKKLLIIHTREGHRPDLSDLPSTKFLRGNLKTKIGDEGPMGRILVRGHDGHNLIPELAPLPHEPIVDKTGKGAFYQTDLQLILQNHHIESLIICGVTLEVCVHTTLREANDRGYEAIIPRDCVASYFPEFYRVGLQMISAQGGIFGWVSDSSQIISSIKQ